MLLLLHSSARWKGAFCDLFSHRHLVLSCDRLTSYPLIVQMAVTKPIIVA